jgi:glycerophosphoryl diester phosphodiesterase
MKIFRVLLGIITIAGLLSVPTSCNGQESPKQAVPIKHYLSFANAQELQQYLKWSPTRLPLISAHRGGVMPGYPENCLATFDNALNYAPCIIECDVSRTKDGVLVMLHDDVLDRTTTDKGKIGEITAHQLKSVYLKDKDKKATAYHIPTLAEVLEWARGKAILTVDVKKGIQPEEIVTMIHRYNAEAYTVVITYSLDVAQHYHRINPNLMLSVTAKGVEGVERLLKSGINLRNVVAFVGTYEPPREVYDLLHQNGIRAILGTMHNLDQKAQKDGRRVYINLLENGADILATDEVGEVAEAIREMERKKAESTDKPK